MVLPLTYNWRNLFVRKLSTLLTFGVVAVVVGVLAVLLSFTEGIKSSLRSTGSPQNIMVLKKGATAESTSIIYRDDADKLVQTPGVKHEGDQLLISRELCVQTSIRRKGPEGKPANVAIRGIDPVAWSVHRDAKITKGELMKEGSAEILVGKAAAERYANLEIGQSIPLGRTQNVSFKVVGIFETGGSALESEIWAPRTMLADVYKREFFSSVILRVDDNANIDDAMKYIEGPAVRLAPRTELKYYEDLSSKSTQLVFLTSVLILIMAVGAVFAVANTMYAAVDGRRREIAMLRTIGFTKPAILISIILESIMICLTACAVGLLFASFFSGKRQDFLSDATWTVMAYELKLTPTIIVVAILLSTLVGIGGALAPAAKAARTNILEALRKA